MMTRRFPLTFGVTAACAVALVAAPDASSQTPANSGSQQSRPRSQNERVVTESGTPSTINRQVQKDEAAVEGARSGIAAPAIPPGAVGSSSVPAPAPLPGTAPGTTTGTVPGAATTTVPGTAPVTGGAIVGQPAGRPAMTGHTAMTGQSMVAAGMDVAMLIEHAVSMAIEGSALQAIAEQGTSPGAPAGGPPQELLDHGKRGIQESRDLMARAAADGRAVPAASPTRRFYDASNAYITTLSGLANQPSPPSPADKAQVALINHSVKEALDANHIAAMGRAFPGSAATEQLLLHARSMKDQGTQALQRLAGNAAPTPPDQPSPTQLAQRGRDLVAAADQLAASAPPMTGMMTPAGGQGASPDIPGGPINPVAVPGGLPINGQNPTTPGRFQDPRPEIIGGTYSTGSPSVGTTNAAGVEAAAKATERVTNPDPNPTIPNAAANRGPNGAVNPPTNSTAGTPR